MKDSILKFTSHKAVIALFSFAIGLGTYWTVETIRPKPVDPLADFLSPSDPFKEVNRLQEQFFASAPVFETVSAQAKLNVEEDDQSIYYDISIPDIKSQDIDVRVENGVVVVQGKSETKSDESDRHSYFSSSFHQTFPWPSGVPEDLNVTKVKIKYEDNRVRVIFPKQAGDDSYT